MPKWENLPNFNMSGWSEKIPKLENIPKLDMPSFEIPSLGIGSTLKETWKNIPSLGIGDALSELFSSDE